MTALEGSEELIAFFTQAWTDDIQELIQNLGEWSLPGWELVKENLFDHDTIVKGFLENKNYPCLSGGASYAKKVKDLINNLFMAYGPFLDVSLVATLRKDQSHAIYTVRQIFLYQKQGTKVSVTYALHVLKK